MERSKSGSTSNCSGSNDTARPGGTSKPTNKSIKEVKPELRSKVPSPHSHGSTTRRATSHLQHGKSGGRDREADCPPLRDTKLDMRMRSPSTNRQTGAIAMRAWGRSRSRSRREGQIDNNYVETKLYTEEDLSEAVGIWREFE